MPSSRLSLCTKIARYKSSRCHNRRYLSSPSSLNDRIGEEVFAADLPPLQCRVHAELLSIFVNSSPSENKKNKAKNEKFIRVIRNANRSCNPSWILAGSPLTNAVHRPRGGKGSLLISL